MASCGPDYKSNLEVCRADFEKVTGQPFRNFYCPILHEDAPGELCMGHVVNDCIPNSCRSQVLQRKDVDGWFGSLFESRFAAFLIGKKVGITGVFTDSALHGQLRPHVEVDGEKVEHYFPKGHKANSHPGVRLVFGEEESVDIALKVSSSAVLEDGKTQLVMDQNVLSEATATMLKAAHLTMFALFGYKYVFHSSGLELARILRTFYLENRDKPRSQQIAAASDYFARYSGMLAPLERYNSVLVKGTIEDRRALACIGTSGHPFALAVLVRTGDEMHMVFLPPDNAANMDTYLKFVEDDDKATFTVKVVEHHPATQSNPARWIPEGETTIRMQLAPKYRDH